MERRKVSLLRFFIFANNCWTPFCFSFFFVALPLPWSSTVIYSERFEKKGGITMMFGFWFRNSTSEPVVDKLGFGLYYFHRPTFPSFLPLLLLLLSSKKPSLERIFSILFNGNSIRETRWLTLSPPLSRPIGSCNSALSIESRWLYCSSRGSRWSWSGDKRRKREMMKISIKSRALQKLHCFVIVVVVDSDQDAN